jgi:hypothetical protein
VLGEETCADGLVLDADSATCVPTDEVCAAGTRFDADSGLCVQDSCREDDVWVDGVCLSQAEALAGDADLVEVENNDPALGGDAQILRVPPIGDEPFVFTGTIAAPIDLDGDGGLDQDVDVFEFEAQAGEWFEIGVHARGGGEPAFRVEGPDGFLRESPLGASQAQRAVVTPAAGTYTVSVLPALALYGGEHDSGAHDGGARPIGGADWSYVGQIEVVDWPTPVEVDISSGEMRLSGEISKLSNNLFELKGMALDSLVDLEVELDGYDAEAILGVWRDPSTLHSTQSLDSGATYEFGPTDSSLLVLVDWARLTGPNLDFELGAKVGGTRRVATILAGAIETLSVQASAYDTLVASQTNQAGDDLETVVFTPVGTTLDSQTLAPGDTLSKVVSTSGVYSVEFRNLTSSNIDANLSARAQSPVDMGTLAVPNAQTYVHPKAVVEGDSILHKVTLSEPGRLHVRVEAPGPDPEVFVLDSGLSVLHSAETFGSSEDFVVNGTLAPGDYLVKVYAYFDLASYDLSVNLLPVP